MLTELMPIPKPKVKRWDYEEVIPQFASREEYFQVVKSRRIRYLKALLTKHWPKVVICYGKAFLGQYRQLFQGSAFENEGYFQTTDFDDMLVILTSHFTARSMNGRFDELATIIQNFTQGI